MMQTKVGARVGSIRLTAALGHGGMGEVYEGFDETLQRSVAVKSIRGERAFSEISRARFLHEARILSSLHHPNLCLVHDYIESDGEAYLIMELIDGTTLSRAIAQGLGWRQKLDIAISVADVLTAAHARGIIHRDLKPDNLMLTRAGQAKVLDFGLARSEGMGPLPPESANSAKDGTGRPMVEPIDTFAPTADLVVDAQHTRAGAIIGTPSYMSPEQARGDEVSPASDMYSFGLVLQHMFMEAPPHEPGLSDLELVKRAGRGESLPVAGITTELGSLIQQLKSHTPHDRPTAARTLARLRRLRERPARRRRIGALILLVLVALLAGTKYTVDLRSERERAVMAREEAEAARDQAQAAQNQAETLSDFLVGLLESAGPDQTQGRDVTVREILDRTATELPERDDLEPTDKVRFLTLTGSVYNSLGAIDAARQVLEVAVELAEADSGIGAREHAQSLLSLGRSVEAMGDFTLARGHYERAAQVIASKMPANQQAYASALTSLANVRYLEGDLAGAMADYEEALDLIRELKGSDHPQTAMLLGNLANLTEDRGDCDRAIELNLEALEIFEAVLGPEHTYVATILNNVGNCYETEGRLDEAHAAHLRALAIREKVLGPENQDTAQSLLNLAAIKIGLGKLDEAQPLVERGTAVTIEAYGRSHSQVVAALIIAVELAQAGGDQSGAEREAREACRIARSLEGWPSEAVAAPKYLMDILLEQGKSREALKIAEEWLAGLRSDLGADHYWLGDFWVYAAKAHLALGDSARARTALEAAHATGYTLNAITTPTTLMLIAQDVAASLPDGHD